jgi:hypothetical protein
VKLKTQVNSTLGFCQPLNPHPPRAGAVKGKIGYSGQNSGVVLTIWRKTFIQR